MQTFPIEVLRAAFFSLVDRTKFVRFSLYRKNRRPIRVKAKIHMLWANPSQGLLIEFKKTYWSRKRFPGGIKVPVKDIRWITCPFDESKLEEQCRLFQKKLTAAPKQTEKDWEFDPERDWY